MNSIHLIGRLTKSPRLTITSTDKTRVNFTLDVIANRVEFLKAPKATTTTPDTLDTEGEAA